VPQLHLHDLRHACNTLAAGTPGTSTRDLMQRMGHDTMRAALVYQQTSQDADRRIADALGERLGAAEESTHGAQATRNQAEVTEPRARGGHEVAPAARRRKTRSTRTPVNTGVQVSSDAFAGVVQWQNISFPS
jgi:hypothetical protein